MNAISDLTARAVSFITAIQTALLKGAIVEKKQDEQISILTIPPVKLEARLKRIIAEENDSKSEVDNFHIRAVELVWISSDLEDKPKATAYTLKICVSLVQWINNNRKNGIAKMQNTNGNYPTPFNWREAINQILFDNTDQRVLLARALQYLPIQVLLALGAGSFSARKQRILQMWELDDADRKALLNSKENKVLNVFKELETASGVNADILIMDDCKLLDCLNAKKVPLAFEQVFSAELTEILKNRAHRFNEQNIANRKGNSAFQEPGDLNINNPFKKAKEMGMYALVFSGGGIRSATFNLGILEGLAKNNLLSKFDYLSTVSGGGYIGSWLAAWIKRDGSVVKVSNRLCPDKSPDPLGEEVKPIKWLRMFSNYFAPKSSFMSADSWTIGVTWLRNTLLNQLIIFLLLLSVLFAGNFLYSFWVTSLKHMIYASGMQVFGWSAILMLPVALLAGFGMHAYHSEYFHWIPVKREHSNIISKLIIAIAIGGAYFVSAWLCSTWCNIDTPCTSISCKIRLFFPAAIVAFFCLSLVAILGKYYNCIIDFGINLFFSLVILFITSALAALAGLVCIAFGAAMLERIHDITFLSIAIKRGELQFIFGVPLALEVFSITVVARMAFLGKYFPDERREWWGRIGAYIHRISFLWILIAASALLGRKFMHMVFTEWVPSGIAATGGWIALVGSSVKAAFSSQTSGKAGEGGTYIRFLNLLSKTGPYLFALGLLIFLPGLINPLLSISEKIFGEGFSSQHSELANFIIILFTAVVAYILATQVGVNEFSMHHFYKNRLVRAYLGATRRSTNRQRTANPFTGFDMLDDEKLCKLTNEYGYYGPYPILNTALNASQELELDRQDRKAESFIFSPLFCGFDFSMIKASADARNKSYDYSYRATADYAFKDYGPNLGTAMAISGAAVNPNQGYHSSAATAFLLTVFNVQMGRWIGNPRKCTWQSSDPKFGLGYIINNLIGKTNTRNDYIALSDGGHFDNMGLYEMIRRKCSYIILCDAEQDDKFTCEGLANAIRRCRIDFGAEIDINIDPITNRTKDRFSNCHFALGDIRYADDKSNPGKLLYIKSSITTEASVDVREYADKNDTFPHQTTADQFFDEEQFESYRKLGFDIADKTLNEEKVVEALKFKKK